MIGQASHQAQLVAHGTAAIRTGSHSFAAAARLFPPVVRESAVMLYAWCRHCDDVVDGQELGHGQRSGERAEGAQRLQELREATRRACAGLPSADPVFAGLAEVVRRHRIAPVYFEHHLDGFAMDVEEQRYVTLDDTLAYCWRVAGVVGVMMAQIMGRSDAATLDRACDLGMAFQLTNIARDVVEDAAIGRIYLPAEWLAAEGIPAEAGRAAQHRAALARVARRLVQAAEPYYDSALGGLPALPLRSAWSIATARSVYRAIGRKVKARGPAAWDTRARTNRAEKIGWVATAAAQALVSRTRQPRARSEQLFKRPA
jgi:phytoene synthase